MKFIGLIGDYNPKIAAHNAIPIALKLASEKLGIEIQYNWISTDVIDASFPLTNYAGLWCTPGSPYRSMIGALYAIQFARENNIPFLGTCGGFQHTLLEFARHVLGWENAEHAETTFDAI